jgi:hypothetical protein
MPVLSGADPLPVNGATDQGRRQRPRAEPAVRQISTKTMLLQRYLYSGMGRKGLAQGTTDAAIVTLLSQPFIVSSTFASMPAPAQIFARSAARNHRDCTWLRGEVQAMVVVLSIRRNPVDAVE